MCLTDLYPIIESITVRPTQPAKIAVTNQKGRIAKTALSINVAGATAPAGYETLLIDLDPQRYLTNGVGLEAKYTVESTTLYDALQYPT